MKTVQSGKIQRGQIVPAGKEQRVGPTEILDNLYYDSLLYGAGQDIKSENHLFTDATRTRDENLCNLKLQGTFTDNRQFALYRFGLQIWSETSPLFYDLISYFSRFHIELDSSRKQILWGDQCGAGGGVSGFDNNASAFTLTNGVAGQTNQWTFAYSLIITPNETFEVIHKMMSGLAGGYDPLGLINADNTDNRLMRCYMRGVEGRNLVG